MGCIPSLALIRFAHSLGCASRSMPLFVQGLFTISFRLCALHSVSVTLRLMSATPLLQPATNVRCTVCAQDTAIAILPSLHQLLRGRTNAGSPKFALFSLPAARHVQPPSLFERRSPFSPSLSPHSFPLTVHAMSATTTASAYLALDQH